MGLCNIDRHFCLDIAVCDNFSFTNFKPLPISALIKKFGFIESYNSKYFSRVLDSCDKYIVAFSGPLFFCYCYSNKKRVHSNEFRIITEAHRLPHTDVVDSQLMYCASCTFWNDNSIMKHKPLPFSLVLSTCVKTALTVCLRLFSEPFANWSFLPALVLLYFANSKFFFFLLKTVAPKKRCYR